MPAATPLFPHLDVLDAIVRSEPPTAMKPRAFFVAWSGVLVLAFEGFSATLLRIKAELGAQLPDLPPENPGSRWPKVTLAALHDGRTLSAEEIRALVAVCYRWNEVLQRDAEVLQIDALTALAFGNRSTEVHQFSHRIPLLGTPSPMRDDTPPAGHREQVARILAPIRPTMLDTYLADIQRPGHRVSHYRKPYRDTTLIVDLAQRDIAYIRAFKADVQACLPNAYIWFPESSQHITVRRL